MLTKAQVVRKKESGQRKILDRPIEAMCRYAKRKNLKKKETLLYNKV